MSILNFLAFWDFNIIDGLRLLCAWLCETIYMLVAGLYDLFMNISRVELLTSEQIHPIYQRITMILTIVMVFYVTFETVKFVIQPEQFSDKEKGASKIVVRMVLVVLLIAFVPQIFSGAYWVQNKIFDTQVFSKVILGKQDVDSDEFGKNLSYNIFSMFYSLDTQSFSEGELESKPCGNIPCKQVVLMNYNQLRTEGKLTFLTEGINEKDKNYKEPSTGEKVEKYYINFNGLFAVGVGAFIAYMLLLYCVDAGVRIVQLLFLQIIAPIPIMAYLSPKKDGMFEKWTKQCLTTYLDLFLRVGIIYFILLICQILGNAYTNGTLVNNVSGNATWLIYIALIMGLLLFAHKAPKMLQELFPKMGAASGNFGLKATERVAPEAARVAGAALGSTRAVTGAIGRGIKAHRRKKANSPDREKEKEHRNQLADTRRRRANLANYEKSAKVRNQKKDELDVAGKEYAAARKARIDAEKQGKTGAELDRLKQQEQIAKQNATKKGQEYRTASDQMQRDREKYLGKEAIEKEKEERKAAALAQRDARLEAQKLQNDMPAKEQERQTAEQNTATAKNEYDKASNSLDIAMQNKANAETRINDATSKIQSAQQELNAYEQQKQAAEATLNTAIQNGLNDPNKIAEMKGQIAGIEHYRNQAQQKLSDAQQEQSKANYDLQQAEQNIKDKSQEKADAEIKLNDAKQKEEAAKTEVENLKNNITAQQKTEQEKQAFIKSNESNLRKETSEENIQRISAEINEKERALESQIAEDINKRRGTNVVTQTLGGVVVGGYHGISEGLKATKLEDIGKKVSEGYKKDIKSMNEVEKYYDNGGTKTWVGRTIDKLDNAIIGETIQPNYKTTQMVEIAPLERQIKEAEASAAVESDVKSKVDSAKSRTEDKLEKEEVKVSAQDFKVSDKCKGVDISGANTVSDVYRIYKANADTKQSIADAAAKDYETKKAAGITGQELVEAEVRARNASQEAQKARYMKEQLKKEATEYVFTQIIKTSPKDRKTNDKFDQVMVEKISDLEQSIANARKNDATVIEMEKAYKNGAITQAEFNAFMSGKFENYNQIDNVQTALINIANARTRTVSGWKEEKRQLETSNVTQAQKADSDFSGSGK